MISNYFIDLIKEIPEFLTKEVKSFKPKKLNYQEIKENKPIEERKEMKKQEANSDESIIVLDDGESLSKKEEVSSKEKGIKNEPDQIDDLSGLLKGIENMKLNKKEPKKEQIKDNENKTLKEKKKEEKKKEDKVENENKVSNQDEYIPLSMRMKKMYKGASIFN